MEVRFNKMCSEGSEFSVYAFIKEVDVLQRAPIKFAIRVSIKVLSFWE